MASDDALLSAKQIKKKEQEELDKWHPQEGETCQIFNSKTASWLDASILDVNGDKITARHSSPQGVMQVTLTKGHMHIRQKTFTLADVFGGVESALAHVQALKSYQDDERGYDQREFTCHPRTVDLMDRYGQMLAENMKTRQRHVLGLRPQVAASSVDPGHGPSATRSPVPSPPRPKPSRVEWSGAADACSALLASINTDVSNMFDRSMTPHDGISHAAPQVRCPNVAWPGGTSAAGPVGARSLVHVARHVPPNLYQLPQRWVGEEHDVQPQQRGRRIPEPGQQPNVDPSAVDTPSCPRLGGVVPDASQREALMNLQRAKEERRGQDCLTRLQAADVELEAVDQDPDKYLRLEVQLRDDLRAAAQLLERLNAGAAGTVLPNSFEEMQRNKRLIEENRKHLTDLAGRRAAERRVALAKRAAAKAEEEAAEARKQAAVASSRAAGIEDSQGQEDTAKSQPPESLYLSSDHGFDGRYDLLRGRLANGMPLWKHVLCRYWLYCSPKGYWVIGGEDEEAVGFDSEIGDISSVYSCKGKLPLSVRRGEWKAFVMGTWRVSEHISMRTREYPGSLVVASNRTDGKHLACIGQYQLVVNETFNSHPVWHADALDRWIFSATEGDGRWFIGDKRDKQNGVPFEPSGLASRNRSRGLTPDSMGNAAWGICDAGGGRFEDDPSISVLALDENLVSVLQDMASGAILAAARSAERDVAAKTSVAEDAALALVEAEKQLESLGSLNWALEAQLRDLRPALPEDPATTAAPSSSGSSDEKAGANARSEDVPAEPILPASASAAQSESSPSAATLQPCDFEVAFSLTRVDVSKIGADVKADVLHMLSRSIARKVSSLVLSGFQA
eukprot:TRINITY_DN22425_c0_g1_i3.p1 TRINITY_DN22425_c0_g1~~TRINITY_DN22425_c0_g1_i3.p1  ORF type:complete len:849 (-),score=152.98 TRINITY_DN22425_c0_g1_i3:98-2644(-)